MKYIYNGNAVRKCENGLVNSSSFTIERVDGVYNIYLYDDECKVYRGVKGTRIISLLKELRFMFIDDIFTPSSWKEYKEICVVG